MEIISPIFSSLSTTIFKGGKKDDKQNHINGDILIPMNLFDSIFDIFEICNKRKVLMNNLNGKWDE